MQRKRKTTSPRDVKDDLRVPGKTVHLLKSTSLSFINASTHAYQEKLLLGLDECRVFARRKDSQTSYFQGTSWNKSLFFFLLTC